MSTDTATLKAILQELQAQGRQREEAAAAAEGPATDTAGAGPVRNLLLQKDALEKIRLEIEQVKAGYSDLYEGINKQYALEELRRQEQIAGAQERVAELEAQGAGNEDLIKTIKGEIKVLERRRHTINAEQKATSQLSQALQKTFGLTKQAGSFSDVMTRLGQDFAEAGAKGGGMMKILKGGFKSLLPRLLMKPIEMFIDQTLGLIKAQDTAISSFRKTTGATAEYNLGIAQTERRLFVTGVTAAKAGKSFEALYTSFSAFTQLNQAQQAGVADTTALMQELGVSNQTTAKLFDQAMRGMGMSVGQANNLVLDLAGSAQGLGVSMDKMSRDFQGAFGELSKYGEDAVEVFKGLAVQSKNTGLEVNQLMKIAKQFDTFDQAGKSVGRLNAILGGPYLNSIDMLNASEEERIDILKRSTDMAGIQFDSLNRFEQQAIASAIGMSVEEANRLFGMSDAQYKLDAMKQKELQELAQETQEIGQQLKSAFMALAVDLRPLIETVVVPMVKGFAALAGWLGKVTNGMSGFTKMALVGAGLAALIAAPFTGGTSLALYAALGGAAGLGLAAAAGATSDYNPSASGEIVPGFAKGGVVGVVGEDGPEMVELPMGTRVNPAPTTAELTTALVDLKNTLHSMGGLGGAGNVAVYVGGEALDEYVVNALDSPSGRRAITPYGE
jgi:hypothetical protein